MSLVLMALGLVLCIFELFFFIIPHIKADKIFIFWIEGHFGSSKWLISNFKLDS